MGRLPAARYYRKKYLITLVSTFSRVCFLLLFIVIAAIYLWTWCGKDIFILYNIINMYNICIYLHHFLFIIIMHCIIKCTVNLMPHKSIQTSRRQ